MGRADLHIHSLASDGVSSVAEILAAAERGGLDVIAVTDHERIDAAVAAQRMAELHGMHVAVVIGEEISTRSGHLVGLFLRERIAPWRSLRSSVARIHDQGGLAIVAHPLVPYPLCASAGAIRKLLNDPDPSSTPMASRRSTRRRLACAGRAACQSSWRRTGRAAVGSSDAHRAEDVGQAITTFPGFSADDLRRAIEERTTGWEGTFYPWRSQLSMFRLQLGKNARALRDDVRGKLTRSGTGRDLGYPGGRSRPARFDESQAASAMPDHGDAR